MDLCFYTFASYLMWFSVNESCSLLHVKHQITEAFGFDCFVLEFGVGVVPSYRRQAGVMMTSPQY